MCVTEELNAGAVFSFQKTSWYVVQTAGDTDTKKAPQRELFRVTGVRRGIKERIRAPKAT